MPCTSLATPSAGDQLVVEVQAHAVRGLHPLRLEVGGGRHHDDPPTLAGQRPACAGEGERGLAGAGRGDGQEVGCSLAANLSNAARCHGRSWTRSLMGTMSLAAHKRTIANPLPGEGFGAPAARRNPRNGVRRGRGSAFRPARVAAAACRSSNVGSTELGLVRAGAVAAEADQLHPHRRVDRRRARRRCGAAVRGRR